VALFERAAQNAIVVLVVSRGRLQEYCSSKIKALGFLRALVTAV